MVLEGYLYWNLFDLGQVDADFPKAFFRQYFSLFSHPGALN